MRTLLAERFDDIEEDVTEQLNFFKGNNLDKAFDLLASRTDYQFLTQEKLELLIDGITVVGIPDIVLKDDRGWGIIDNKACKCGTIHYPGTLKEWERQLNCYAYLLWKLKGIEVSWIENHMYFQDYSPLKARDGYPDYGFNIHKQPLWSITEQENYIRSQLEYHATSPYDCPEEERWSDIVVLKKGRKNALIASVPGSGGSEKIKTKEQALAILKVKGYQEEFEKGTVWIESRIGTRCKFFCGVKSVCRFSPLCQGKYTAEK